MVDVALCLRVCTKAQQSVKITTLSGAAPSQCLGDSLQHSIQVATALPGEFLCHRPDRGTFSRIWRNEELLRAWCRMSDSHADASSRITIGVIRKAPNMSHSAAFLTLFNILFSIRAPVV
ncbi:hypothetical protein PoB_002408600 [Plakobranchus ocellatus]|uniref:Uncharacterized protein n=1 Tax=Plakobranchus ocellatus TaxID=259542 RepID=A0AAV3ZEB3_9GAST|nr:hypothetical protein PoB_002408600 [Plakobranchus ocellatus]